MNVNLCRAMRKEDVHEAISMDDFLQVQLARVFATAFVYRVHTQLAKVFVAAFVWKLYTRLHLRQYMQATWPLCVLVPHWPLFMIVRNMHLAHVRWCI